MARPDRSLTLSFLLLASLAAVTSAPDARAATLSFAPAVTYATGGAGGNEPRSVAVGDFNGDGRPDLAHTNFLGGVSVRLNDGTGAFPTSTTYGAGAEPNAVAVGDLNGDLLLDLAVANRSGSSVSVLLGNGDGTFDPAVTFTTGAFASNPYSVAIGDLNTDGKRDLAVVNVGADNVAVLLNTAAVGAAVPSFAAHVDFAVGDGPFSVAIGDLSGDGNPDLVTANEYNDTLSVLVNTTASGAAVPTFAAHVDYAAADGPLSVVLGLLNADGNLDLAAANIFAGRNVSVLTGNGDGTFAGATNFPLPAAAGSPYAVVVGDFDGEGGLDLATANFNGPSASVLLGDGSGVFTVGGTYATGNSPYSVAAGDFNGDGRLDLVTSNFFGTIDGRPSLSVLLNTSASAPTIAKAFVPFTVALGQSSTLTFTLVNPNPTSTLTGIAFTDTLPSDLVVAGVPGVTNTCGGIVSATAGSGAINLTAGTLAGGATCTIGVNVSSAVAGIYNNTTGPISASETGAGATSNTATLAVVGPPAITKAFGATSIPLNGSTWLEFTIFNNNASTALTGVGFTDTLPAGLVVATPNGLWGSCGGAVTAVSGSSSVSLTGGTLVAASTCAISVNVVGTSPGVKDNSVTAGSTEGGTGSTATASLTVAAPPVMTKAFGAASIPLNGTTSLSLTIDNPNATLAFTGLAFNDAFPAGLAVAATPNLTNTCGGTATAAPGATSISLSAGTLAAAATCSVSVDIEGTSTGVKNNSAFASSTEGGTGATASASLTVGAPPVATKAFGAASIPLNGTTSLTLTINNPNADVAFTGLSFTDAFPAGIAVAATPNLSNTCGGTATAAPGAASVSLTAATLAASATCTVSLDVQGVSPGLQNNSVTVSAAESGAGNAATASITIVAPPTISKSFGAPSIPLNGSTSLSFTINNPNTAGALSAVGFVDTLPAGLVISTPNGLTGSCGAGAIAATAGAGAVSLSGATLAAGSSCTFSVNVTGTTGGSKSNVTGNVTSAEGGTGSTATASIVVVSPPTIAKAFNPTAVAVNGTSVLTLTITNPATNALPLTGVAVTDNLPAGLVVTTPNALTNTCGGVAMAVAGSGSVSLAGGTLASSSSCTLTVNITGTIGGNHTNTTGPVSSTEGGTGTTASAGLTVGAAPGITKTFGAASIAQGGTTSLSFTITNPNSALPLSNVSFTDTLPAGLVISTPNGLTGSCGGGTITATAGSSSLSLTGGAIASLGSCTFAVNVTGTTAGTKNNTTGPISSTESGPGATSNTASLVVVGPPTISKAFGATSIPLNGSTSLSFTINNPNSASALSGVGFVDTLPAGLVISTPNGLTGSCGTGAIAAAAGAGLISLSGGSLAGNGSCTFSVNVTGTTGGIKANVTGSVTSAEGGTGSTATASITVVAPPTIAKAFNPTSVAVNGTSVLTLTITNPAANASPLTGVAVTDNLPAGLVVATPNALTNTCAGVVTAVAGSGSVSLTGGALASNASCTLTVNITGTTGGNYTNVTGPVSSTEGGTGATASANLTVGTAPGITKAFGAASIALNGTTSLSFTITNPNTALALNDVAFTDTLPAGLVISTPNGLTGSCGGGTITATAGASSLSLTGGAIASLGSCTFAVNVTGTTSGTKDNTTGPISSTESGPGATSNTASLVVVAPPTFAQAFGAATIPLNSTTPLTFDLGNPNAGATLTGIGFTEALPAGLAVASGTVGACGGTITTISPGTITLAGATLAPSGTCTFAVTVTGVVAGEQNATSGNVASVEGGLGGTANASVIVVASPTISKVFAATTITPGGTTTLSFTLRNPAPNTLPITGLAFDDAFPAGMLVATPNGLVGSCDGGTITAAAGSGVVSLSGATLAAGGTCTFTINVVITGNGVVTNTTGALTSSDGGSGGQASASITVSTAAADVVVPTLTEAGLALFGLLLALLGLAAIRGRLLA